MTGRSRGTLAYGDTSHYDLGTAPQLGFSVRVSGIRGPTCCQAYDMHTIGCLLKARSCLTIPGLVLIPAPNQHCGSRVSALPDKFKIAIRVFGSVTSASIFGNCRSALWVTQSALPCLGLSPDFSACLLLIIYCLQITYNQFATRQLYATPLS
jgi:hypothetical protein